MGIPEKKVERKKLELGQLMKDSKRQVDARLNMHFTIHRPVLITRCCCVWIKMDGSEHLVASSKIVFSELVIVCRRLIASI